MHGVVKHLERQFIAKKAKEEKDRILQSGSIKESGPQSGRKPRITVPRPFQFERKAGSSVQYKFSAHDFLESVDRATSLY